RSGRCSERGRPVPGDIRRSRDHDRQGTRRAGLPDPRHDGGQAVALQAAESGHRSSGARTGARDMSPAATPLMRIPVGVVVARHKAASQWIDYTWAPVAVLHGVPEAQPWTVLRSEGDATMF